MTNPYNTPPAIDEEPTSLNALNRRRLAGAWLAVAGMLVFLGVNSNRLVGGVEALDWTPVWLVGVGVFVSLGFRVADTIARLLGSFSILGTLIMVIALLCGDSIESEVGPGAANARTPSTATIGLIVLGVLATWIPPWWLLQTALRK